jgi:hypothetical protein
MMNRIGLKHPGSGFDISVSPSEYSSSGITIGSEVEVHLSVVSEFVK